MGLVEAKMKVLEKLWEEGKPMALKDVAQKTGLKIAATNMHLLGLKKTGHVSTPQHGHYAITDLGKEAIGLPKIDKAHATKILGHVSTDKAFHFYTGLHQHLGVHANSLADFCDKIEKVSVKTVEFHVPRKDFENWFRSLGDIELAKRMGLIHNMNLHGEELRKKVHEAAKHRLEELKRI
jgi:DNA-binding CsgD family transcriptional regulator